MMVSDIGLIEDVERLKKYIKSVQERLSKEGIKVSRAADISKNDVDATLRIKATIRKLFADAQTVIPTTKSAERTLALSYADLAKLRRDFSFKV